MINTIIFDFGGVLVDWNPRYVYRDHFQNDEKMEWFLENICTDDWNIQQDCGRGLEEATNLLLEQYPEHQNEIKMYYGKWETMLKEMIPESVEILYELKGKYPLYGLTNWSAETFPIALKRFDFFQAFDGILVSGEEKLIKPDRKIFELMMEKFYLKPENCLFIDDNLKNVEASREFGIETIHFTNPKDLREKLVEIKLL
ncbi:HAD family hydrolase [Moheibacter sediminis]|uniref:2-haloacid dehalogenase n=1 Tax=Moheibacter sediminis TaxID=1434700 RepID=A0A1W1YLR3_9FLAO|nr:HAD family phosphatase [Moheibacter sediminis]SMC37180.1 2-haloacid dehalogenase [Moheibacter sediminis]